MKIKSICPYCDHDNAHFYDEKEFYDESYRVVFCDSDSGCDERYVIDIPLRLHAKSYKIEGGNGNS